MKIGDVARLAGVGVDTVRYYERRGLLPEPARRASGYRDFTAATIDRILFAKELQTLGFTLDEICDLLRTVDAGTASCSTEQQRFELVLQRVDEKLAALRAVRGRLANTLRRCRAGQCRLLDAVPAPTPSRSREEPSATRRRKAASRRRR